MLFLLTVIAYCPLLIVLWVIFVLARLEYNLSSFFKVPGVPIIENFFVFADLKGEFILFVLLITTY